MKIHILPTSLLIGILAIACSKLTDETTTTGETVENQVEKADASTEASLSDIKDFTFEQRQVFSDMMKEQIAVIESEIQSLEALIVGASASVKGAAEPNLAALRERADALNAIVRVPDSTSFSSTPSRTALRPVRDTRQKAILPIGRAWISKA